MINQEPIRFSAHNLSSFKPLKSSRAEVSPFEKENVDTETNSSSSLENTAKKDGKMKAFVNLIDSNKRHIF